MPWFQFTKDFDYRPHPNQLIAYKKDQHLNIKQDAADQAKAAGAGHESGHKPARGDQQDGSQEPRNNSEDGGGKTE